MRAWLRTDAERATFDATVANNPLPKDPGLDGRTRGILVSIIQGTQLDPDRKANALAIVRTSMNDELASYNRNPAARAERNAIIVKRNSDVRALLTGSERGALDSLMARVRRSR